MEHTAHIYTHTITYQLHACVKCNAKKARVSPQPTIPSETQPPIFQTNPPTSYPAPRQSTRSAAGLPAGSGAAPSRTGRPRPPNYSPLQPRRRRPGSARPYPRRRPSWRCVVVGGAGGGPVLVVGCCEVCWNSKGRAHTHAMGGYDRVRPRYNRRLILPPKKSIDREVLRRPKATRRSAVDVWVCVA